VARAGQHMGGYGEEELRARYESGELLPTDNYWREGMTEWGTLGELLAPGEWIGEHDAVVPQPQPASSSPSWIWPTVIVVVVVILGVVATVSYFSRQMAAPPPILINGPATVDGLQQPKIPLETQKAAITLLPADNDSTQVLNGESTALLKEIEARSESCRDAEKDMLLLGFNPDRLTSVDEIEKRRQSIKLVLPRVQSMINYLVSLDKNAHDDLLAKGVSAADASNFVAELHRSGHQDALMTYWKQEAAISIDMLSNLDLLKANYGKWHLDGETVVFNDSAMLTAYRANVDKIKADIATQQAAQAEIQQSNQPVNEPANQPANP
jgi:hypothetical protein